MPCASLTAVSATAGSELSVLRRTAMTRAPGMLPLGQPRDWPTALSDAGS